MYSVGVAYLLWFFLGVIGAHRFYVGKLGTGLLYLVTGGLFGVGWFFDLFRIPGLVREANLRLRYHQVLFAGGAAQAPPRVKESRVQMECRVLQIVTVSDQPGGGSLVMGEVLRFHVDDAVIGEGAVDPDKLRPIGRMGGTAYARTSDRFEMVRPKL